MMPDPILRLGDQGRAVRTLQQRLNRAGAQLVIDHIFGPKTDTAVRAFQAKHHLVPDGTVGPLTHAALQGRAIPCAPLDDAAIAAAAAELECSPAAILAVMDVEAPGTGYLPDGRLRILYERHLMYRHLKAAGIDPDPLVQHWPDIVNPAPGGYLGGNAEYGRLAKAKTINAACAVAATSWGRFQILGAHAKALGYATPGDLVDAMRGGEAEQLRIFCAFVTLDPGMHKALRERDWHTFARAYNGPAYAENQYAERLALAYARHGGETEPSVPAPAPPEDTANGTQVTPPRKRATAKPGKRKPAKVNP